MFFLLKLAAALGLTADGFFWNIIFLFSLLWTKCDLHLVTAEGSVLMDVIFLGVDLGPGPLWAPADINYVH